MGPSSNLVASDLLRMGLGMAAQAKSREHRRLEGPVARVAVVTGLIVVLLASAIGITLWRYSVASSRSQFAIQEREIVPLAEREKTMLWIQQAALAGYASDRAPADLPVFDAAANQFDSITSAIDSAIPASSPIGSCLARCDATTARSIGLLEPGSSRSPVTPSR